MHYELNLMKNDAMHEVQSSIFSINPDDGWNRFRRDCRELCDNFLTIAAASLLVELKLDMFFLNLCRSAENWRRYLVLASTEFESRHPSLHYNLPLLAAVIAGDEAQLGALQRAMPSQWQKGEEYEDQYYFSWLVLRLARNGCQADEKVIEQLEAIKSSDTDGQRTLLFNALLAQDDVTQADFWEQFESSLYQYDQQVEEKSQSAFTYVPQFAAQRYIWFEGLVWLKLARQNGFVAPASSYKYCPEEALRPMPISYSGDWVILSKRKL